MKVEIMKINNDLVYENIIPDIGKLKYLNKKPKPNRESEVKTDTKINLIN